jgi:hypothetical protein
MHGEPCTPKSKTEFYAVPNGTVFTLDNENLIIAEFENDDEKIDFAPAKIDEIDVSRSFNVTVLVAWLRTDEDMRKSYNPDYFELPCWMPISVVYTSLEHAHQVCKNKMMPKYRQTMHEYESDHKQGLLSYSESKKLAIPPGQKWDLFDMLQFFHCRDPVLWHTPLGMYIFDNFVYTETTFGMKPRMDLVSKIMTTTNSEFTCEQLVWKGTCDCGKKDVILFNVITGSGVGHIRFGSDCIRKVHYLHDVGILIQNFRNQEDFIPEMGTSMMTTLSEMYFSYKAERDFIL